jgi:hypothetical protein
MSFEHAENYDQYLKYLALKEAFHVYHRGIDIVKACSMDIIEVVVSNNKNTVKQVVDYLSKRLNVSELMQAFQNYDIVFTTDCPKRKDHIALLQKIRESVKKPSAKVVLSYKRNVFFNVARWIKYYCLIAKQPVLSKAPFLSKLFLASKFIYASNIINVLDKHSKDISYENKKYIPFNLPVYTEAVIAMYVKQKRAVTFHIFHCVYSHNKYKITNDFVLGENFVADYILPFGEINKMDLIHDFHIPEEKIFVAGNPKYPEKRIKAKNSFKYGIVFGTIDRYDEYLAELIPILDEISETEHIKFDIKPHPLSHILESKEVKNAQHITCIPKDVLLYDLLTSGRYDFAVTHNTSAYYECMYYNLIPFRWKKGENHLFEGFDDHFFDKASLLKKIEYYKNQNMEEHSKNMEQLLKKAIGMGVNNYDSIINKKSI